MQFMVTAYDGTDPGAVARRREARPAHLERIKPFVDDGSLVFAGALLNEEGRPIGSVFAVEFESLQALRDWITADPYTPSGVWKKTDIAPIRIGVRNGLIEA